MKYLLHFMQLPRFAQCEMICIFRAMEAVLYCLELDTGSISKGELDLEKLFSDQPMPKVMTQFFLSNILPWIIQCSKG